MVCDVFQVSCLASAEKGNSAAVVQTKMKTDTERNGTRAGKGVGVSPAAAVAVSAAVERVNTRQ